DAFIEKKHLYAVFAEYCRTLKLPTVTQDTFFKNLPKHIAVTEYRPSIEKTRMHTFKGIRYSANTPSVSTVSKVFYTLMEKADAFNNDAYKITKLNDAGLIKVEIALDSLDRLDREKHKQESLAIFRQASTIQEVIEQIRFKFSEDTKEKFQQLAIQLGGLTENEAEHLFNQLVDEGKLAMTPTGLWRWC
ncbi:MAG: hypothetical protein QXJ02_05620, partial [Candidatus Bathyarchaeia archaeon]